MRVAKRAGNKLTHLDGRGQARMVDVGEKAVRRREALAEAVLKLKPATLKMILGKRAPKGDVLAVARVAGIQAAKRTPEWIPLCHAIPLSSVKIEFEKIAAGKLRITARAICHAQTGVEMEALCAASAAALTVYDMVKAVDRGMEIQRVRLLEKSGGKSGLFKR